MEQFYGECFICGVKGTVRGAERPMMDNCPKCNSLLSIHYKTETEVVEETKEEHDV